MSRHPVLSSGSSTMHRCCSFRLAALLMVITLFLTIGAGCSEVPPAPTEEKGIDTILITRSNALLTPTEVKAEITDPAQIEALLSLLENVAYREQKNPYDTPEAKTILGTERITLRSSGETVAEYQLRGCLYIRSSESAPWRILSNDCWQEMWKALSGLAPFDNEGPPYGVSLPGSTPWAKPGEPHEITSVRLISSQSSGAYVLLDEPAGVKDFCDLMHNLKFREPKDSTEAAPFYDGGGWIYITFHSGATIVEEYYVYDQFVSPTVAGPSSIMTEESCREMQNFLDSLNIIQ